MTRRRGWQLNRGANKCGANTEFRVWAPRVKNVEIKILGKKAKVFPMKRRAHHHYRASVPGVKFSDRYYYVLDGQKQRPDPVSRFQPEGVHGPSQVMDTRFPWTDSKWKGMDLRDLIFYELHPGTFTPEGTLDAAIRKLNYLKKLGITCVEVMPVAQFPGARNWGYDGVSLYAVQNSYGGPQALKRFVNACHRRGIAACLDVVYNHLGPEGNYLHDYGPYFTSKYHTPWGDAVNFDDRDSRFVRQYFVDNALYWVTEFHFDALRLDAIHGIFDRSRRHILREIQEKITRQEKFLKRKIHVIAESDLNETKIIRPLRNGGYGLAAQWSDDYHHALHRELTGEKTGYYQDFRGLPDLAKALQDGFVYDGRYSRFRRRRHGTPSTKIAGEKFVVFSQNHDQVGNRAYGDRLNSLISFRAQKLSAAVLLFSPYLPLLFMGQEYGETAPFQYFVDHGDPALREAVRRGRQEEFRAFGWKKTPDPASVNTFRKSRLRWDRTRQNKHALILKLYRDLIALRKEAGILKKFGKKHLALRDANPTLSIFYQNRQPAWAGFFSFSLKKETVAVPRTGKLKIMLYTDDKKYGGRSGRLRNQNQTLILAPQSAVLGCFD